MFFVGWAPHSASNDGTADISQSKRSEREKAVFVTYCCIINYPKLQAAFGFSCCLWTRNLGALALGLSKGCNPGVSWDCRHHNLRFLSLTWDGSSVTQLSVGLSSLPRGPLHQAAGFIRASKQEGSYSHCSLLSEVTSLTFTIFCLLESGHLDTLKERVLHQGMTIR